MAKIRKFWISREELLDTLASGRFPVLTLDATRIGGLTTGSIPFADAAGFLTEDNAALFWDETNDRLGLNQTTPTARIDIVAEATFPGINIAAGAVGEISTPDGQQFRWGHWNEVDTFTERLKFDAAGLFYVSYLSAASVVFAGAGGEIKQDNANFYWDNTNKRLGIGKVPANVLDVEGLGTAAGGIAGYTGTVARFHNTIAAKHTSVSIDALTGYDPILYFAENGVAIWEIRNDASATDTFNIRYQVAAANRTDFKIDNAGNVTIPTGTLTLLNEALHLLDTGGDHDLIIKPGEDLAADTILTLVMGDAARTITLSGNPTLGDWFDQAVKQASNVSFGTIGCGTITVADGSSISLQEDITFTGATTENLIKFPDNLADALSFMEGANPYLTFITTDNDESILLSKPLGIGTTPDIWHVLHMAGALGWVQSSIDAYNATDNYCSQWKFRRSHSDTKGTKTETEDDDFLGDFWFQGVDNGGNFDRGASIKCEQEGASGVRVPARMMLETYDNAGKNTNQLKLQSDGKVFLGTIPSTDAGDYDLRYDAADGIVYDTSDIRQKKNLKTLNYGLAEILQLQPKSYKYYVGETRLKIDEETEKVIGKEKIKITDKSKQSFGLIAQEVYDIIPEAVYKPEDESVAFWGLREKKLIPVLINAIKELNGKIKALEAQLNN